MERLPPFEPSPAIAVAVSGGADSMALTLLANDWARARGGTLLALTVDHGMRPESAAEAARVAAWLAARGIAHRTLVWRPATRASQAEARDARYRLLGDACAAAGIRHLLTAHHRGDQAETVLMRIGQGSGIDGLAGIPAERATPWGRILRPLLEQPKAALEATCRAFGQAWVEDPSNRKPDYLRSRVRAALPELAGIGLDEEALARLATLAGRARAALEEDAASLLAEAFQLSGDGDGRLAMAPLRAASLEVRLRALAAAIWCVGGQPWPVAGAVLERAEAALVPGARLALGRCRVRLDGETLTIVRERRALPSLAVQPGESVLWDGRLLVRVAETAPGPVVIAAGPGSTRPTAHGATAPGPTAPGPTASEAVTIAFVGGGTVLGGGGVSAVLALYRRQKGLSMGLSMEQGPDALE